MLNKVLPPALIMIVVILLLTVLGFEWKSVAAGLFLGYMLGGIFS